MQLNMTVCLLLAAGSSSRMGQPKMMLPYKVSTLLQHIINEVKATKNTTLLVVTGCYHNLIEQSLLQQQIPLVKNEQWQAGMGSSIQTGMAYLLQHYPTASNVLILVCDQPFITTDLLKEILTAKESTGKGIVACTYAGAIGTPVLFDKKYFNQLLLLQGASGAKKLVHQFEEDLATVNFPEGSMDIDTPEDYGKLMGGLGE
jgi:molybdenum cofactor cytidylyltransferase